MLEEEHIKLFNEDRDKLRQKAKLSILNAQEEKKNYNKKAKQATIYKNRDLDLLFKKKQFQTNAKLEPKNMDPYQVIAVLMKTTSRGRYSYFRMADWNIGVGKCTFYVL